MGRCPDGIKKFFNGFDVFSCIPSLRARGESDVSSVCGGVTSLLLMMFFIYVFIASMISMANYQLITASKTTNRQSSSTDQLNDLVFAIGFEGMSTVETRDRFNIRAFYQQTVEGNSTITGMKLTPCTEQIWSALSTHDLTDDYNDYNIGAMLCLDSSQTQFISGLRRSDTYSSYIFLIEPCTNGTTQITCQDTSSIDSFMQTTTDSDKSIIARFLYLNTGFNVKNQKPSSKYVEDHIWLPFTQNLGTEAFVEIGVYSITTDTSFLPFATQQVEYGSYLANYNTAPFERKATITNYITLQVSMSAETIAVEREYGKIDDRLSYLGGLFEIVIIFLSFFMGSYNLYRYELMVSEKAYSDSSGKKAKEEDFHFFKYIKYSFFEWISLLCCCDPDWEDCKKISEARNQVNEQMDVEMLLRRITHLEDVVKLLISQKEEKTLYLKHPHSLETHRQNRKYLKYYDKILKNDPPYTIENHSKQRRESFELVDLEENEKSMIDPVPSSKHFNSFQILEQTLKMSKDLIAEKDEEDLQRQQEDIEEELASAYLSLNDERRYQIQKTIPLKILKRLKAKDKMGDRSIGTEEMTNVLHIRPTRSRKI